MLVERSSYPHTNMKYIKIFIFFIYSFLFICLYISDAKIVILFLLLGLLYNYLAFGISERYDRLNRPILYNINSDKIKIVYYNKKAKKFTFDSIKKINVIITEVDHIELEIIDIGGMSARMFSDDFEDFPNVFCSFIKLAKNAEISRLSSYIRRSKLRTELEDDRDLLEILREKEEQYRLEKLNPWRLKF